MQYQPAAAVAAQPALAHSRISRGGSEGVDPPDHSGRPWTETKNQAGWPHPPRLPGCWGAIFNGFTYQYKVADQF